MTESLLDSPLIHTSFIIGDLNTEFSIFFILEFLNLPILKLNHKWWLMSNLILWSFFHVIIYHFKLIHLSLWLKWLKTWSVRVLSLGRLFYVWLCRIDALEFLILFFILVIEQFILFLIKNDLIISWNIHEIEYLWSPEFLLSHKTCNELLQILNSFSNDLICVLHLVLISIKWWQNFVGIVKVVLGEDGMFLLFVEVYDLDNMWF